MSRSLLLLVWVAILSATLVYCDVCKGKVNSYPIYTGEPVFVSKTANGLRYFVESGTDAASQHIHVLHLYGTALEMGKAYGELMKEELHQMTATLEKYWEKDIEELLKFLPEPIRKLIAEIGFHAALDLVHMSTQAYTPQRFVDELQGVSLGSGVNFKTLRRLNLLPELTQAHCSIVGAWGNSTLDRNLIQLRALDWDWQAPINRWPIVVVYHPTEPNSNTFANMGYVGMIGSITGFSTHVGIGEKVWYGAPMNTTTRIGKPWMYVLRDALQFGKNVDNVLDQFAKTKRTAAIFLGVGEYEGLKFRGVQYAATTLQSFNWDQQFVNPGHPRIPDVVYWDKHVQPSQNPCLGSLLQGLFGNIDAKNMFQQISALAETGNTQTAVYDFRNQKVYLSYSSERPDQPRLAYDRQFVELNMAKLFAQQQ